MDGQAALGKAPDAAAIEAVAKATIERLPAAFRAHFGLSDADMHALEDAAE